MAVSLPHLENAEYIIEPPQAPMASWDQIRPGSLHVFLFTDRFRTECGKPIDHVTWGHPTYMSPIPMNVVCRTCAMGHELILSALAGRG